MKKKIDIYSVLTVLTLVMMFSASCRVIDDGERPDNVGTEFKDEYVMAVRIYDTATAGYGTKADEFDSNDENVGSGEYVFNKGLDSERAIWPGTGIELFQTTPHFMFFFDAAGDKIGDALKLSKYNPSDIDETPEDYSSFTTLIAYTKEDDPVQKFGTGKVLVVLNANQYLISKLQTASTYDEMAGLLCEPQAGGDSSDYLYLDDKGTKYFTMTSSMIVNDGAVGPASAPVNPKWYKNETDARLNPSYEMYVERPHVKYTLLFKKGNNDWYYLSDTETDSDTYTYHPVGNVVYSSTEDLKLSEDYKKLRFVTSYTPSASIENRNELNIVEADWKVNISGWGINATERNEYLFKKIQNKDYYNGWNPDTYSNRRTFWAEDENYAAGDYPDQYRQAEGVNSLASMATHTLDYFSYAYFTTQKKTHIYSPENTFSVEDMFGNDLKEAYDSKAYLRVGTHAIVAAQLLIDGFDAAGVYDANQFDAGGLAVSGTTPAADKYCMNGIYWSESAYKNYVMEYLGYWMLSETNKEEFGSVDGRFYVDAIGTPASGNDFTVESVNIKGGDSYVWVKPAKTLYVKTAEDTYTILPLVKSADAANYTDLAFDHQEYFASHFAAGRMYYYIPVKHNFRTSTESVPIATGDYGAVRNHWYFFEVDGVMAPGTAVDVPDQEIVPNNEPEEIGLGVNISILDWHKITIDDVDVSDQPRPQPPTNSAN